MYTCHFDFERVTHRVKSSRCKPKGSAQTGDVMETQVGT